MILLSVCMCVVWGEVIFNLVSAPKRKKKEVRETVINKLRTQQHKGTTKDLAIVSRSNTKNKKKKNYVTNSFFFTHWEYRYVSYVSAAYATSYEP